MEPLMPASQRALPPPLKTWLSVSYLSSRLPLKNDRSRRRLTVTWGIDLILQAKIRNTHLAMKNCRWIRRPGGLGCGDFPVHDVVSVIPMNREDESVGTGPAVQTERLRDTNMLLLRRLRRPSKQSAFLSLPLPSTSTANTDPATESCV